MIPFLEPRIEARCPAPGCGEAIGAVLGRLSSSSYNSAGHVRVHHRGWIFKCSACGLHYCVAGRRVYPYLHARPPVEPTPEGGTLDRLRHAVLDPDSRWHPPRA